MDPGLEALAYAAALRSLDKQEELLRELRARTGIVLASSSVVASLLGRSAFDDLQPLLPVLIALATFMVSLGASLYVLTPRTKLVFSLDGAELYEQLHEFRSDPAEVHRRLAYQLHRFWTENERELAPILVAFSRVSRSTRPRSGALGDVGQRYPRMTMGGTPTPSPKPNGPPPPPPPIPSIGLPEPGAGGKKSSWRRDRAAER